jgi:outer membrane protein TolC
MRTSDCLLLSGGFMLLPRFSRFVIRNFHHNAAIVAATVVTFFGAFAFSPDILAADAPLTLAAAQRLAIQRSKQLAAQDFAVTSSREMAIAAGQLPDPVLKAGIDNLPVNGADRFSTTNDFMTMRRIGVMQEITRSDKRQLRTDLYNHQAEKTLAEKNSIAATIERDTAIAWIDRYYAEAMAAAISEQSAQAKLEIEAAESAYRSGRGSQADVFSARSALAAIEDRASEMQRRIRNAKTMLARWIGDAADVPLSDKPDMNTIHLDAAQLDTQLIHHPQIAVLNKQEEIAETEAKLAQANKKSDWSVEVAYQQRGPAYANMISVGVSLPFQLGQRNLQNRELASKLAMVEQVKAEREDKLREHVAETRSMINEWENNRERHARYERELLPLANQRTESVLTAYRGGKASLADVLAARRNEIDIRIQALQLDADTARLWAQLNFLSPSDDMTMRANTGENKDAK